MGYEAKQNDAMRRTCCCFFLSRDCNYFSPIMQCTKKGTIAHSCITVRWACSEAPSPLPRSTTLLHRRCGNVLPVHDGTLLPLRRGPFANSHSKVPRATKSRSRTSGPKTSFPLCLSLCLLTPSAGSRGPQSGDSPIGPSTSRSIRLLFRGQTMLARSCSAANANLYCFGISFVPCNASRQATRPGCKVFGNVL